MKKTISILLLMTLLIPQVYAQMFASNVMPKEESINVSLHGDRRPPRPKAGTMLVMGIVSLSLGCILGVVGELEIYIGSDQPYYPGPNQSEINTGYAIAGTGAVMIPVGVGLIIAGAIHDHRKAMRDWHKSKLSIVAPGRNEVGLAYNF